MVINRAKCAKNHIKLRLKFGAMKLLPTAATLESVSIEELGELICTTRAHKYNLVITGQIHETLRSHSDERNTRRRSFQALHITLGFQLRSKDRLNLWQRILIVLQVLQECLPYLKHKNCIQNNLQSAEQQTRWGIQSHDSSLIAIIHQRQSAGLGSTRSRSYERLQLWTVKGDI